MNPFRRPSHAVHGAIRGGRHLLPGRHIVAERSLVLVTDVSAPRVPLSSAWAVVNAQDNHLYERFEHRALVLVILPPVTVVVASHDRGVDAPAALRLGELRFVNTHASPAAVQVKPLVGDEGVPLVIHVPGHVTGLDHGPLRARPDTVWRRNVLRLRNWPQLAE